MGQKRLGKRIANVKNASKQGRVHTRPSWLPRTVSSEEELCPDCFRVVGERSRYAMVCMLGKTEEGMTVGELTEKMRLKQPTVTHHLQILNSVDAVSVEPRGKERVYRLKRDAHCFEECHIPY